MKSKSSLIFLPNERQSAREAEVMAIGPEVRDCKVGQTVLVGALVGQEVGDELVIPESAVLGFAG